MQGKRDTMREVRQGFTTHSLENKRSNELNLFHHGLNDGLICNSVLCNSVLCTSTLNLLPDSVLKNPFYDFHSMSQQFNPSIRSTLHRVTFAFVDWQYHTRFPVVRDTN